MHRSSDSIAAIAAALAKAQTELANPEKLMTATVRSPAPGEGHRSFRYAPLSAGLDLVRKSLGRHEIATLQTTEIDRDAGLVRLTTVLAHSSGEWISSDWPVCLVSEIAAPQQMGAALTYARRHSLFALVGIAGEDDRDASDLPALTAMPATMDRAVSIPTNGHAAPPAAAAPRRKAPPGPTRPVLAAEEATALRDRLLVELGGLSSAGELSAWARQALPAKNTLSAHDAELIEEAFEAKLRSLNHSRSPASQASGSTDAGPPARKIGAQHGRRREKQLPPQAQSQLVADSAAGDAGPPLASSTLV
jgi:hypothetical protein